MAPRRYFYQSGQMVPIARLFAMGFYSTIWPLPKKTGLRIQEMMYRINNNPGEEVLRNTAWDLAPGMKIHQASSVVPYLGNLIEHMEQNPYVGIRRTEMCKPR